MSLYFNIHLVEEADQLDSHRKKCREIVEIHDLEVCHCKVPEVDEQV